jgi:ATP-dependent Clp protease ATP-binding subunit ClpB
MTSNLGSHLIQEKLLNAEDSDIENILGDLRYRLTDLLRKTIRPEFLNRIDEVVLFKPLSRSELRKIVDLQIEKVEQMLKEKDIIIRINDESRDWLAQMGYDVTYGARPLKRTIQKYLVNPLSADILMGKLGDRDIIEVTLGERGHLEFRKVNKV